MTSKPPTRRAPLWIQITAQLTIVTLALAAVLLGPAALAAAGWGAVLVVSIMLTLIVIAMTAPERAPRYRRSLAEHDLS